MFPLQMATDLLRGRRVVEPFWLISLEKAKVPPDQKESGSTWVCVLVSPSSFFGILLYWFVPN